MPLTFDGNEVADCTIRGLFSVQSLVRRSHEFVKKPTKCLAAKSDRVLYISQREYGTVIKDDKAVGIIGSEDATTCHIVILVSNTAVSIGHFDGCDTKAGLCGMLAGVLQNGSNEDSSTIEAHIFGGFMDERKISSALLEEILSHLSQSPWRIDLKTACVHSINNNVRNQKNEPVLYGVAMDVLSREIFPASFQNKGPNEALRHARIYGGCTKMIDIYDSLNGTFSIGPFHYEVFETAPLMLNLSDSQILQYLSTSPHCEPPYFATTTRMAIKFLIDNPDPTALFIDTKPIRYQMNEEGEWISS